MSANIQGTSESSPKEATAIFSKTSILKWAIAASAAVGAATLAVSYFWGGESSNSEQEISELPKGSSLVPLVQDICSVVSMALPSLASLGAAAHVLRGEQNIIREETGLQKEANDFLELLGQNRDDLCISTPTPFWPTDGQCFSLAAHEKSFQQMMDERRSELSLKNGHAARYGNKHSNLEQMAHLDAAMDLQGLEIPTPAGIASDDVVKFLQKTKPEIFERWESLGKLYANYKGEKCFLQTKEAKDHLQRIDELIREAFSETTDLIAIGAPLDWLQEREEAGDFLMVRSTGAEDSKKLANAGGNLSRAYVRSTPKEVLEAAGSVVASYFGEKSLQNRINSQINPFNEPLQLAVTMQKVIGEPIGGAKKTSLIPVSFVVFTNEPLFIGNEQFRIMRISASYGHGEGVVGNKGIATDTIFLLLSLSEPDKLYILYQNQKKASRLVPVEEDGKIFLKKIKNPKYLAKQRALNDRMLAQIYRSAFIMESFHEGEPTDIEGVVQDGVVYFVQARPIIRKPLLPTFLRHKEGSISRLQANILVSGAASVLSIEDEKEVLFAPTLEIAEELFIKKGLGSYRLIVVSEPDPPNSHSVVTFSSLAIPCLWTPDLEAAQDLLQNIDQDHKIAVCMQTGSIHLWDQKKASLEESIEEGFGVHPADIAVSLPIAETASAPAKTSQELHDLLIRLRDVSTTEEAFSLLQEIVHFTTPLKQEIVRIEKTLKTGHFPLEAYQKLQLLQVLDAQIDKALREVEEHSKNPKDKRLRGLFLLKTLEALLLHPSKPGGVGEYSLLQTPSIIQSIDILIEYQEGLSTPALLGKECLAGHRAAGIEAFSYWLSFLKSIEIEHQKGHISKEKLNTLKKIISSLEEAGALSQWIYLLPQHNDPTIPLVTQESAITRVQSILQEFPESTFTRMEKLKELQGKIEEQLLSVDRFSNQAAYETAWRELTELISLVSSQEWLSQLEKMSPTHRIIAYRVMEKALELLDTSLKKVKLGNFGSDKGKIFKNMLKTFCQLLKNWEEAAVKNFPAKHGVTRIDIAWLEKKLNDLNETDEKTFLPSNEFSVETAITGIGPNPETLEDMLTIFHQMSIQNLSSLHVDLLPPENLAQSLLPSDFKQTLKYIEQTNFEGMSLQRIGIKINEDVIEVYYNVPLKHHSGQLAFIYDTKSCKMRIKGGFLGPAEYRWSESAQIINVLEKANILKLAKPLVLKPHELRFIWETTNSKDVFIAMKEYAEMSKHSKIRQYSFFLRQFFERWTDNPHLIPAALEEASQAISAGNNRGVDLYDALMERGHGHLDAFKAAEKAIASNDPDRQISALLLYQILIKKDQKYSKAALAAAEIALTSKTGYVQSQGKWLHKEINRILKDSVL